MTIKSIDEIAIYESPDGGKTVYARKPGETNRVLVHVDPEWRKEQELQQRWINLKGAVYLAENDPTLNDAIRQVELIYTLKKEKD